MIDAGLKQRVRERARDCCEYCRLRQENEPDRRFHIEHIIARRHRGADDFANLALACTLCNLQKGACIGSLDPDSNEFTRLFHPRLDDWAQHFRRDGAMILGLTAIGRTTVWLLDMNCDDRVKMRRALDALGELE
jgi:hypothetical protein